MSDKKKAIAIGYEDFKEIINENCYFVDKTLMIKELLEVGAKVSLFTRPRRFGKTLNQSMIRRFFEDEITEQGEHIDNTYVFEGLNIMDCGEDILKHQGKYPVISLSLKSAKQPSYDMAYDSLVDEISKEFKRHKYVLNTDIMSETEKEEFELICDKKAKFIAYAKALGFLSECLAKYHGRNVYILIDEYDVPLENAYFEGFYDEMTGFIRSLFESALKTNPYLEKGIITGCLRISKESIFTGLNNLKVYSLLSNQYCDKFGFTPEEVQELLAYYDLSDKYPILEEWYDGYKFGNVEIYNPWSIVYYLDDAFADDYLPKPHWSNTSSNSIIKEMIYDADEATRRELEILMDGGTIEKPIHEDITYEDMHSTMDNLWNFLFFAGYLKAGNRRMENENIYMEMSIPNTEIKTVYRRSIKNWFDEKIGKTDRSLLIKALEQGDCEAAEDFISSQLMDTISYFDYAENYYHGFMTGLLAGAGRYNVVSNRESGNGRPDIILEERKFMGRAMIMELKISDTFKGMESKCAEGLKQIEDMNYAVPLEDDGYQEILKYAVCFFKKGCMIRKS